MVNDQSAALSHGIILGLVERIAAKVGDCSQCPSFIGGHHTLGSILDDLKLVPGRDIHNGIHFARDARVMDGDDGFGAAGDGCLDFGLINIHGIRTDIHKYRYGAGQNNGGRGAGKGIAGKNDFIPGFQTAENRRHFKGRGPAGRQEDLACIETLFDPGMAFLCKSAVAADLMGIDRFLDIFHFCSDIRRDIKRYHRLSLFSLGWCRDQEPDRDFHSESRV